MIFRYVSLFISVFGCVGSVFGLGVNGVILSVAALSLCCIHEVFQKFFSLKTVSDADMTEIRKQIQETQGQISELQLRRALR